jgi:hypothetical protein
MMRFQFRDNSIEIPDTFSFAATNLHPTKTLGGLFMGRYELSLSIQKLNYFEKIYTKKNRQLQYWNLNFNEQQIIQLLSSIQTLNNHISNESYKVIVNNCATVIYKLISNSVAANNANDKISSYQSRKPFPVTPHQVITVLQSNNLVVPAY